MGMNKPIGLNEIGKPKLLCQFYPGATVLSRI